MSAVFLQPLSGFAALGATSDYVYNDGYAYNKVTHHSYELVTTGATYADALAGAVSKGGYLVIPNDSEENEYLQTIAQKIKRSSINTNYWIGIRSSDDGTKWICSDGTDATYTYFISDVSVGMNLFICCSIPNNLNAWYTSTSCESERPYIIEYDECQHAKTEIKQATYDCEGGGYTGTTCCALCGEYLTVGMILDGGGTHNFSTVGAKTANCFEKGYTGDYKCSKCTNCILGEEIPKLEHNYSTNGTCTLCGSVRATDVGTFSVDYSKNVFSLIEYTPTADSDISFASTQTGTHLDTYGYLYNDKDKAYSGIEKYLSSKNRVNSFTDSISYNDDGSDNNQPKINYSVKGGTTYYFIMVPYSDSTQINSAYTFDISITCSHKKTHIVEGTATCTEAGTSDKTVCDNCNEVLSGGEEVEAYGHDENAVTVVKNQVERTCTTDGNTGDTCCKFCDEKLADGTTIPSYHSMYESGNYSEEELGDIGIYSYGTISLFGEIDNSTFKDFSMSGSVTTDSDDAAFLANDAYYCSFENITTSGSVESIDNDATGIVCSLNYSTMTNCTNYANVNSYDDAGGVCCSAYDSTLTNCKNYGDIEGDYAGGIAAKNVNSKFINCSNYGKITAHDNSAGGIAGYEYSDDVSSYIGCTNSGEIVSDGDLAGGIVGYQENCSTSEKTVFENCSNSGSVTANGDYAGGIISVGRNIELNSCFNFAQVSGEDYVGGIAGSMTGISTVSNCNNIIPVIATGTNVGNISGEVSNKSTVTEHTHSYVQVGYVAPTCTVNGYITYSCTNGDNSYSVPVSATGHNFGNNSATCLTCGSANPNYVAPVVTPTVIAVDANNVKLSSTSYTYDKKTKTPTVKAVANDGSVVPASSYTVKYQSGRKNVGRYTVTITFGGNYSGTVTKTFDIKPKSTSISSVSKGKKKFTVKWKKQTTQTTGYQISYSTSKKFTSKTTKTSTVSKNKTTSKTISKLKGNKKYYVRVRTYKTVKVNGKSVKIYSSWSKTKTVTTKK